MSEDHLSIRLDSGRKQTLEQRARAEGLSLSAYIRRLLDGTPSDLEGRLESLESRVQKLEGLANGVY
jgi:hypothetical protein